MWQTPVRCHLTAWLNPLIVHLFFWCWEWRWEVPLVYPDFVVTLNYPTGSIPMGVEITWEENAPNKTNLKDLLRVKWMSEALSLLSAIRILQEGWAAPLCHIHQCYNSLLVPERFLHSQGKGGLHNSFYIKQLALAFPSFGCLKLSHLYLSGLSVEHWQMGSLPASQVNYCWFLSLYRGIISIFQVTFGFAHLCGFSEWVRKQLFLLSKWLRAEFCSSEFHLQIRKPDTKEKPQKQQNRPQNPSTEFWMKIHSDFHY